MKKRKKVVTAKKVVRKKANTRFPGLPDYTGPNQGWFAFMHHGQLAEYSLRIEERIGYIQRHKPSTEIPVRLRHLMYLGDKLSAEITAAFKDDGRSGPYQESRLPFKMRGKVLTYVRRHKPDHTWHDGTLHFTNKKGSQALGD